MIYVLLADGFEEIEALCPVDVLRRAGLPLLTVAIGEKNVTGAHGICVTADITAKEAVAAPEHIDALILPGGMPGAKNLDECPATDALIARTLEGGGHIGAICAAPFILGRRGLLRGRTAVCFPGFESDLEGATVQPCRVVTDGPFTTAVGMGAAAEFALELVRCLAGEEVGRRLAENAFIATP